MHSNEIFIPTELGLLEKNPKFSNAPTRKIISLAGEFVVSDDKMFKNDQNIVYRGQNNDNMTLSCHLRDGIPYTHVSWFRLPNESRALDKGHEEFPSTGVELVSVQFTFRNFILSSHCRFLVISNILI